MFKFVINLCRISLNLECPNQFIRGQGLRSEGQQSQWAGRWIVRIYNLLLALVRPTSILGVSTNYIQVLFHRFGCHVLI